MDLAAVEQFQETAFLHISDLHFREDPHSREDLSRDHSLVLDRLLLDLGSFLEKKEISLDFILLNGDVGFSGKKKEYRIGAEYLGRMLKLTQIPKENVVIVPGNHDVNRAKVSPILRREFRTENEVDDLFGNKQDMRFFCRKFGDFKAFMDDFVGPNNHGFRLNHPYYCRVLEIHGRRIGIAALNSALNSHENSEYGRLLLGEHQVQKAIKEIKLAGSSDLSLAMFHHPLNFFSAFDSEITQPLLMKNFDIILNGHMHGMETLRIETPDTSIQILAAGSGFDSRTWHNSYNIVTFDFARREGVLFSRRWNSEAGGHWAAYPGPYDRQNESGISFQLPEKRSSYGSTADAQLKARSRENRILQQLTPVLIAEQKAVENDKGYVPLTFSRDYGSQNADSADLETHLDKWIEGRNGTTVYLVGEYGAGKSRFLRHYAAGLAQRFLHNPDSARVPILVILSQHRLLGSFERLLTFTLADRYGVHVSPDEIKDLVLSGRIVLLLDGFDELAPHTESSTIQACIKELSVLQKDKSKTIISTRSGYLLGNAELRRIFDHTRARGGRGVTASIKESIPDRDVGAAYLYLQDLDEKQIQSFIDRYPEADDTKKETVRLFLRQHGALREMSQRPVIIKLLLDCDIEVLSGKGITHVSEFYKHVTETWISGELARKGVADETGAVSDAILGIIEVIACRMLDTGAAEIDKHAIDEIALSADLSLAAGENVPRIADWLSTFVFIETTPTGGLRFKHRSFTEFFIAWRMLRMIKQGKPPEIGEQLPSIEILDFLRDLFDKEAADRALHILGQPSEPTNIRVALMIGLRSLPGRLESYLRTCLSNSSEDFGIRRVAAMSLAENDVSVAYELARLLSSNRKAQHGNLCFLRELWKADNDEIIRRTRYRLSNMYNSTRRYWKNGRCIHIATLGQIGGKDEADFLKVFLEDPDPEIEVCARIAIVSIESRISPEARALDKRLELARRACREAGELLMKRFRSNNPVIRMDMHDVTTQADIDAQKVILDTIHDAFPEDAALAEESPACDNAANDGREYRWIVDPLDGSVNFYAGLERFAVAIAIERSGELQASVVHSPAMDEIYWARLRQGAFVGDRPIMVSNAVPSPLVAYATSRHSTLSASELGGRLFAEITARFRSIRLSGSAALDFCDVASGRLDCLVKLPGPEWDFYPGFLLVDEAGGVVQRISGFSPECDSLVVAASCQDTLENLKSVINGVLAINKSIGRE